eukprot:TRINITY_DN349_c0_g2_i1.p1 TRINITY_DN349_c0_g2~~TRINITY_DN349_c0_g2_i1.p1  ORF type:complete len:514 (+),score=161.68 TRINITY_DN349_c0_g2_i1:44-1585(+)
MMQRLAILAVVCGLAAGTASEPQPQRSDDYVFQETLTSATTLYHYVGESRQADVNLVSVSSGCATCEVSLVYATITTSAWCTENSGMCSCLEQTNSSACVNMTSSSIVQSDAISPSTHMQFFAHGRSAYSYFMAITVSGFSLTCTSAAITVTANVSVTNVNGPNCVRPVDTQHQLQKEGALDFFNAEAATPYHPGKVYELTTRTATSPSAESTSNIIYYNLGAAPQIEMSCLHVHVTPSEASQSAGCPSIQLLTYGSMPSTNDVTVDLLGVFECSINGFNAMMPDEYAMCCGANKTTCLAGVATGACLWDEGAEACYTTWSMHTTSMVSVVDAEGTYVFASNRVHGPQSSYVSNVESLNDWPFSVWNRRWLLAITNKMSPTGTGSCDISVSTSFVSVTTGGLCEPSSRQQCDATMDACLVTEPMDQPRYWKQYEVNVTELTFNTTVKEEKYGTCNCLKQKEVCYRKGGCTSTKKYQLILQNCLDQGCGNYCNSGAGVVASLVMSVLAVLVVML